MRRLLALAALVAAFAWTCAGHAQDGVRPSGADSVTLIENGAKKTRTGVVVESADSERVIFVQAAKRITVDGADVVEIRRADAPREYEAAVAALRLGDAASAAAGFEAVLANRGATRAWILEAANAGLGEALLALASAEADEKERCVRVFTAARDANPKSLLLDRILGGLARAEIARGRPDAALDAATALADAAKAAKRPAWETEAQLVRAEALDEKNDDAGALAVLDEVIESVPAKAAALKDADAARRLRGAAVRAAVRKSWLLVDAAAKPGADAARAKKFAAEMATNWPAEPAIAAAAIDAEGVLLLAAGDAKSALRKFLEVDVVHFGVPEQAARALRHESVAWDRLGDPARSADALKRLARTYPATEAARRAR